MFEPCMCFLFASGSDPNDKDIKLGGTLVDTVNDSCETSAMRWEVTNQ